MRLLRYYLRLLKEAGYSVAKGLALPFVRTAAVRSGGHALPYPAFNTHAPWLLDREFQSVYRAARENTLVDEYRCWELWSLVAEVRDVPGTLIEVGVWRGGSGALIAARARSLGIADPVYLCDTWAGVVKAGDADLYYSGGEHSDTSIETVRALVDRMGLEGVELLQGVFPDDTGGRVAPGGAIRFCHIDVDVYKGASDVFEWVWERLSRGGAIVFDDYGGPATVGVARFVDEQRMKPDRLVFHNLNGHGIIVKR